MMLATKNQSLEMKIFKEDMMKRKIMSQDHTQEEVIEEAEDHSLEIEEEVEAEEILNKSFRTEKEKISKWLQEVEDLEEDTEVAEEAIKIEMKAEAEVDLEEIKEETQEVGVDTRWISQDQDLIIREKELESQEHKEDKDDL